MLRSLKQLYGDKLGATDGEIGHIKDFYFDDQDWVVRYVVAETGSWLVGRQVLVSPRVLGRLDQAEQIQKTKLTRKQIEGCPTIETHKPVSRQYEEEYYKYYGLPSYWQGDSLWGMTDFPILELPVKPTPAKAAAATDAPRRRDNPHLRSTLAVTGYHVQVGEGKVGHIADFMIDAENWAIGQLVVRIGHRFSGKDILIPTKNVSRVSYEESTVFVDMTTEAVEQSPVHQPV